MEGEIQMEANGGQEFGGGQELELEVDGRQGREWAEWEAPMGYRSRARRWVSG